MIQTTAKGSRWRRAIQEYLEAAGWDTTFRRWREPGDDITATRHGGLVLSVEAKNTQRQTLAAFIDQAERQARARGSVPIVWMKRRGKTDPGAGYVLMTGERLMQLLGSDR